MAEQGIFIVLEGPEGSGKSTQARRLGAWFEQQGRQVLLTREPGGTALGERIRSVVLDVNVHAMLPQTETLLYTAARAEHVADVIRPALAAGNVVICDRFADSTLAYQGGGRQLPLEDLQQIQRFATGGLEPDVRLLLDLPVEIGLARRMAHPEEVNRLDAADLDFHQRVRSMYHKLVSENPDAWRVVDAAAPVDDVTASLLDAVARRFGIVNGVPA